MESNFKARIKNRINDSILKFRNKEIDHIGLIQNLYGNINAIENLDRSVINAYINLCAELETIYYMYKIERHYNLMLKEVDKFKIFVNKI